MEPSSEIEADNPVVVGAETINDGEGTSNNNCEIEELKAEDPPCGPSDFLHVAPKGGDGDDVYVAVGKSNSSMEALSWSLKNAVKPWSFVYLVHVFPIVHQIPTPLGNVPKNQLSKEQVESYMSQEREKRHQMLQKYLNLCRSHKVKFDVYLIESDQLVNAVVDLISVMNIKLLVVGTSKSKLKRLKKGNLKAGQIQKNAPLYCNVKIVCDGKEVSNITERTPPASPTTPVNNTNSKSDGLTSISSPSPENPNSKITTDKDKEQIRNKGKVPVFLRCFSSKSM